MSDIVKRLRDDQPGDRQCVREARMDLGGLLMEAADEIEKLRAKYGDLEKEIGALRVALKKISVTAGRKDETPEALLVVCDAIARAPLGEGP
jgi:hypothetical protein